MPFFRSDGIVLAVLLLCVPVQYLFVRFWGQAPPYRSYSFNQFVNKLSKFHSKYLKWESWKQWCLTLMHFQDGEDGPYINIFPFDVDDPNGVSPAVEVIKYKKEQGYFGQSQEPRIYRPPSVKYKVGQVIEHKNGKFRGVIIGWDETVKAPPEWLKNLRGEREKWRYMPNYAVLVDTRDKLIPQMTYIPQENIKVITNVKIMHPALDDYFEAYDGSQYIPRPLLKGVYPHD